ncbi:MAG TPA: hypothetical protein VNG13_04465 [Mycobacteriales bacterium]|nr:hypothetical protein [Mycobacteriales bacterium]
MDRLRSLDVNSALQILLRVVVAAALAVDAFEHAKLAPLYDGIRASVSQGNLFRAEAGVAAAVALLVLVVGRRVGYSAAFLVAASALGAVLLYRYADVGRLGPLPNMYDPGWFPTGKPVSAIAEAVASAAALVGLADAQLRRRRTPARSVARQQDGTP